MRQRASARPADVWLVGLACVLAVVAIVVHVPGHVSMDGSEQLYEAQTGESVSWSPPFMSALLRLWGGGAGATTLFVITCAVLTYAGLALAMTAGRRHALPAAGTGRRWQPFAIAVLIANPLVFLYVGIVWKDVLLAALLATTSGLLLHAQGLPAARRRQWCVVAMLLLVPLLLVRQQGMLLAPPLLAVAAAGIAGSRTQGRATAWWLRWLAVVAVYAVLCWVTALGVRQLVQGAGDKSTAVGFAAVQRYDLTGMLALGGSPATSLPQGISSEAFMAAVKRSYGSDRIDIVLSDPEVQKGFLGLDGPSISNAWWSQLRERPAVFLAVKARQFAWLIGVHRLDKCLPLHIGVEGNAEYLEAVGIQAGADRFDQLLFDLGLWSRHLVLYRHWFYLGMLVVCVVHLGATLRRPHLAGAQGMAVALLAFYGSYAATTIACDFRYLYPGLVGTSVLAIYLLSRGRGTTAAGSPDVAT